MPRGAAKKFKKLKKKRKRKRQEEILHRHRGEATERQRQRLEGRDHKLRTPRPQELQEVGRTLPWSLLGR